MRFIFPLLAVIVFCQAVSAAGQDRAVVLLLIAPEIGQSFLHKLPQQIKIAPADFIHGIAPLDHKSPEWKPPITKRVVVVAFAFRHAIILFYVFPSRCQLPPDLRLVRQYVITISIPAFHCRGLRHGNSICNFVIVNYIFPFPRLPCFASRAFIAKFMLRRVAPFLVPIIADKSALAE